MHRWKRSKNELPVHDDPAIVAIMDEFGNYRHCVAVRLDGEHESIFDMEDAVSDVLPAGWYAVDLYSGIITEELYTDTLLWQDFPYIRSSDEYRMMQARRRT